MVDKIKIFSVIFMPIFLFLISFVSASSASFIVGNPDSYLGTVYGPSSSINGWINVSFNSEPLNAVFNDSIGNSANLSGILSQNPNYVYTCNPSGCAQDYYANNGMQSKIDTLNTSNSKIYGFIFTGNILSIDSIDFFLSSNAGPSCTNQIEVDFLDNSTVDAINQNPINSACSTKNYGCFDSSVGSQGRVIGTTPYCEEINMTVSPGFFIGAWINGSGQKAINASLYDTNGNRLATCLLPNPSSPNGEEVSCNISHITTMPEQDYVCISGSGNGNYIIQGYDSQNGCGLWGIPSPYTRNNAAYRIFAQGMTFDSVGTIELNKSQSQGLRFADLATRYIKQRYGNSMDCTSGCIVPVRISSNSPSQTISLSNLQISYQKTTGQIFGINFYDLTQIPAKITSGFQQLYISNTGFYTPAALGNYSFSLKLDNQNLISKNMQIVDLPEIRLVTPLKTASAYQTNFTVSIDSSKNLTNFLWDFGDNYSVATQGSSVTHTYTAVGIYNLTINVTDQRGLSSSKTFMINVSSPRNLINSHLNEIGAAISNINGQISSFTTFQQIALNSSLNINNLTAQLSLLRAAYNNATTDADYNNIVSQLVTLTIPDSVYKTATASNIPFVQNSSDVNLNVLQSIGGGNYSLGNEGDYTNAISLWQQDNVKTSTDYDEFSGSYSGYLDRLVKVFIIKINEQKDIPYGYYLILPQLDGFSSDSNFTSSGNYVYLNLKGKKSVSFSTTENVDITNLPASISPSLGQLGVTITTREIPPLSKWFIFAIIAVGILILAIVVYMVLRSWYDKRYENYLFKNRNDLYNMINYVNNAKGKGMENREIEDNLKKVGWSAERIRYVMRKYAGKRTGLI